MGSTVARYVSAKLSGERPALCNSTSWEIGCSMVTTPQTPPISGTYQGTYCIAGLGAHRINMLEESIGKVERLAWKFFMIWPCRYISTFET